MTDSTTTLDAASRFLRVPLEIRWHIYRFLLLDPPVFNCTRYFNVPRFPATLCTNRQIYSEASTLLYAELNMHLDHWDIDYLKTDRDAVEASDVFWRHNPLKGVGTTDPKGHTVYVTPEMGGVMEPHVLARFRKITFGLRSSHLMEVLEGVTSQENAGEETEREELAPSLFVDENLTVNPEDEAKLLAFYRRLTIFNKLVKILSNFPDIVRLEITLDNGVFNLYHDDMCVYWDFEEERYETTRRMALAGERAVDLFLDSGLLAPLEKLSSVRSFAFEFSAMDRNGEYYEPTSERGRMLSDLKQKIERNYATKVY